VAGEDLPRLCLVFLTAPDGSDAHCPGARFHGLVASVCSRFVMNSAVVSGVSRKRCSKQVFASCGSK
jgi:hypothetical protein